MPTSLKSRDDRLHPLGSDTNWQESYYFNFHNQAGWAGHTYISLAPHKGVVDRIIVVLPPEGGRTLIRMQTDPLSHFGDEVLTEGVLQYHCLEPLQRWQLQTQADCFSIPSVQEISSVLAAAPTQASPVECVPVAFDLRFEAGMPAYLFPAEAWDFLGQDQQHFEQVGQFTGWLRVGDEEISFVGTGARDRSWGIRDWSRCEWYCWINIQFGGDFFIDAALSRVGGQEASTGFVYQDGRLQPIVQVALEAQWDPNDMHLLAGRAWIATGGGQSFDLDFVPLPSFLHVIVAREGNWQNRGSETMLTCHCEGQTGRGFMEYFQMEPIQPLCMR
jgi:hypothetical protein